MTDRIALVTGASRGLGFALAEALAPRYHIVAVGRTTGALEALDDRIKAKGGSATLAPNGHRPARGHGPALPLVSTTAGAAWRSGRTRRCTRAR
ncbi:Oxidoreductase, short-chain dehydrogenase/reductase family [Salipiger mucosus DSM 16094]|uniref:Oxidoreductase, short-chain dehydrogenase/reductase family n=1 Tax=Salipiger mucosus DSM 16094 TaxID=1123237 RepID=S9RV18_9RHOB|nr:Oxidoreductase, short-chain dehydrogenase/reductase family [Salipiger mucosus DSM 16094]